MYALKKAKQKKKYKGIKEKTQKRILNQKAMHYILNVSNLDSLKTHNTRISQNTFIGKDV